MILDVLHQLVGDDRNIEVASAHNVPTLLHLPVIDLPVIPADVAVANQTATDILHAAARGPGGPSYTVAASDRTAVQ